VSNVAIVAKVSTARRRARIAMKAQIAEPNKDYELSAIGLMLS